VIAEPPADPLGRLWSRTQRLRQERWLRVAVTILGFAAVTLATYLIAHPRMFSSYASYDDEGYMLTALKSFVNHGHLYDDVFTQYGPFYYELWGGLFSVFGIDVSHDAGRIVTLVVWVGSSLVLGLVTWRMTRSLLLGLGAQALGFIALEVLANEPMHPGGLITALLVAILACACFVRERPSPLAMGLLGAAIAALILTKINVGGFALVSLALVCVVSYPALSARRWLRPLVELIFVALPIVLTASKFSEEWARHYGVHVAVAALAVVLVLRTRSERRRPTEELWWLLGGLLVVAAVICLAIIGSGTSVSALVEGVITQPLRQGEDFTIALVLAGRTWAVDAVALGLALGYWYAMRMRPEPGRGWTAAVSALSVVVGLEMALSVIGKGLPGDISTTAGFPFAMLAFAWLALVPAPGSDPSSSFVRLYLPALAVLQALHAFPVAGSQIGWSTFLLVPVGALCVANGVRGLTATLGEGLEGRGAALAGAVAALAVGAFLVQATLKEPLDQARANYDSQVSLDLPGANMVRLPPEEVETYRDVTAAIDRSCPAFLTEPGMGSFYLWTEQEPPTGYVATAWTTLFDEAHQQRVIEQTRGIDGLCLLRNLPLAANWSAGTIPSGPLLRYLERGFEPIAKIGDYELLKRPGTGSTH
jgi:hypothetical protein